MTPVPLELPPRLSDATELANLIFEHAELKSLTGELRHCLAARAMLLELKSVKPWFGSRERDPVHPFAHFHAAFAARINSAFYPQPQGARAAITVEQDHPAAWRVFRAMHKRTAESLQAIARAAAGRVNIRVRTPVEAEFVAEHVFP